MSTMSDIEGDWNAVKTGICACGYTAVWKVAVDNENDGIIVKEQMGAKCCGCVPNPVLKTHKMKKAGDGVYQGTLGFKPIRLEKRSDKELYHVTTDGPMIMTRE